VAAGAAKELRRIQVWQLKVGLAAAVMLCRGLSRDGLIRSHLGDGWNGESCDEGKDGTTGKDGPEQREPHSGTPFPRACSAADKSFK